MVIELLLLLSLGWLISSPSESTSAEYRAHPLELEIRNTVDEILTSLLIVARQDRHLYDIIVDNGYILRLSDTTTYVVEKRVIYLLVWNYELDRPYDLYTVLEAAIHELAHVLCPELEHTPTFDRIEQRLLFLARTTGLLAEVGVIDSQYVRDCCH
jgi:hypothetical protein